MMATKERIMWIWSFIFILVFFQAINYCDGRRYGFPASTLHLYSTEKNKDFLPKTFFRHSESDLRSKRVVKLDNINNVQQLGVESGNLDTGFRQYDMGNFIVHRMGREKRSSEDAHKPIISHFPLNDSHEQLSVLWAGKNSKVVICLARNRVIQEGSSSRVFFSYNYGRTFSEVQEKFMRISSEKMSIISMFYISPVTNSRYIFTDVIHSYLFLTQDFGETFESASIPFKPEVVAFHPTRADVVLGMDKNDKEKKLWLSEDFGVTWNELDRHVKSFFWGVENIDADDVLFVERQEPDKRSTILKFKLFKAELETEVLLANAEDFEVREKYIFATKRQQLFGSDNKNGTLQLWISYNRGPFQNARFPNHLDHKDFYIADASEDQVFVCVMHDAFQTNLYISDVKGTSFSLSLERVLYLSSKAPLPGLYDSDDSLVDIHKVDGLRGVYIATQVKKGAHTENLLENLVSVISFDKGGEWVPLRPPKVDHNGNPISCQLSEGCSLHLTHKFNQVFHTNVPPILSKESAVGIIVGSGVVGKSLKGHPSVFVSSDAGISWHEVLNGNYQYTFGDFGGIIVAVQLYNRGGETNWLLYSMDMGETWKKVNFTEPENSIRVYGLMTEPGEKTTVFTIFGSLPNHHKWILVKVDLQNVFLYTCKKDDYKEWIPHAPNTPCLLGRKQVFERRIAHVLCYNGRDYERPVREEECPCSREDYECDFGFKEDDIIHMCVRDPDSEGNPYAIPDTCSPGNFYNRTKGYRKVSGDMCKGGSDYRYDPELISCPDRSETEFLLFAQRTKVSRIPLNMDSVTWDTLAIPDLKNVIAVDYDYHNNCVFWADINLKKIMRMCFDGQKSAEILVESDLMIIEGLAFDWISKNLYFVDGGLARVEVIRTDINYAGRMRRELINKTVVDKPRGIALHPARGLMFLTDWSSSKPSVARAYLDGSNFVRLFDESVVAWPNGIAVDFLSDRIFWVDARKDYIASADLDGRHFRYVLKGGLIVPHPFSVTVFKDWIYFDDWNRGQILEASKVDGAGLKILVSDLSQPMALKAFGHGVQQGTNMCQNITHGMCSHLCMGRPNNSRTCLCPDGMKIQKLNDGNEKCLCPNGEALHKNGTCVALNSTCAPEQFTCSNELCIPNLWKCDGDNDCGDSSDEYNCQLHTCDENQFLCPSGRCIPATWKCDTDKDCEDASDEKDCHFKACGKKEFQCDNGRCIQEQFRCDFDNDCGDNTDERNCTTEVSSCESTEFRCTEGGNCVPAFWRCDGDLDCKDGSDEKHCVKSTCAPYQFHCNNSRCIFATWRCDSEDDCGDGSDEENCTTTPVPMTSSSTSSTEASNPTCSSFMMRCDNEHCIPFWWQCDGVDDCGDNSDEETCGSSANSTKAEMVTTEAIATCGEDHFRCLSGKCIRNSWVCDGDKDCEGGEDEKDCSGVATCGPTDFHCFMSMGCVPESDVCNGIPNCGDSSDEWNCNDKNINVTIPVTCNPGQFTCLSGECLSFHTRCDDKPDCYDGSDEEGCVDVYRVEYLTVDVKSVTTTGFTVMWKKPIKTLDFEYKLSYRDVHSSSWRNTSWVRKEMFTFQNLLPGISYSLGVYVRRVNQTKEYSPSVYIQVTTEEAAPSPPLNVTVAEVIGKKVVISWEPPQQGNLHVSNYKVYFSPPTPPLSVTVNGSEHKKAITFYFKPGETYTFWVTAVSGRLESLNSLPAQLSFAENFIIQPVTKLRKQALTNTSVTLVWDKLKEKVDGYIVEYRNQYQLENYLWMKKKTKEPFIKISPLAPGSKYTFRVCGYNGEFKGGESKLDITTPGKPLQSVNVTKKEVNGTRIKLEWTPVDDGRQVKWVYGIYLLHLSSRILKLFGNTTKTKFEISNLEACQLYSVDVRIIGPYGIGPSRGIQRVTTEFDHLAPPKVLVVTPYSKDSNVVRVQWEASCQKLDQEIGYNVMVREKTLNKIKWFRIINQTDSIVSFNLTIHCGGIYIIQVQTNHVSSRPTAPVRYEAPPIPAPTRFLLTVGTNKELHARWEDPVWPVQLYGHSFSYVVWVSMQKDLKNAKKLVQTSQAINSTGKSKVYNFPVPVHLTENKPICYVAVSIQEEHGYSSSLTDVASEGSPYTAHSSHSVVLTDSNLVSIIVPIVVVIIALSSALICFIVRHRRLQRSFLSFANSHYDTRSGATTFSTGDELGDVSLDEEDSPMIRGFSDDEPLVIA
ncbi:sortilin-related receptor-like isoform X2 [Tachypleus tridentatus]|uniref:sortilin-related receptor-like isoform X2 n=1 Tax=Tachypleus tridentatus TaxID=6853 RepID=UPI003FD66D92